MTNVLLLIGKRRDGSWRNPQTHLRSPASYQRQGPLRIGERMSFPKTSTHPFLENPRVCYQGPDEVQGQDQRSQVGSGLHEQED